MSKKTKLFIFAAFSIASIFAVLPVFAQGSVSVGNSFLEESIYMNETVGPVIFGRVLNAWVSLIAAMIVFVLALKYMKGGYLARPLLLIGFGVFVNSLLGLIMSPAAYAPWMWAGNVVVSLCVIVAIFWIERLFRALQS